MFNNIQIETERLIIRTLDESDAEQLHRVVSQEEVVRYLPEDVMSIDEVREIISWLRRCYNENRPDKIIKWTLGIVLKETGTIIGWVGLGPLDFSPGEIEIFYGLSQEHWGRGIATEASCALLKYGFETIGLKRIVAVTKTENVGSAKVLEKLGMRFERTVTGLPEEHRFYEGSLYYSASAGDLN
jgi:ribosomal-protein-alanine N-acetyltransferase